MTITRVSKTRRGRFALFADEEFLFSVDEETLAKSGIGEGFSVTEEELSLLRDGSETRKAKDAALRYLSLRGYGEEELYRKLCLKYDEHTAAAAVAAMVELELLDDKHFAQEKAKGMARRGKSPFEIRRKLAALGIDRVLAEEAVAALEMDGNAAALAVVEKSYMDKLAAGQTQKVKAALARRGFSYGEIAYAITAAGGKDTGEDMPE